jgi:hypothetical protein
MSILGSNSLQKATQTVRRPSHKKRQFAQIIILLFLAIFLTQICQTVLQHGSVPIYGAYMIGWTLGAVAWRFDVSSTRFQLLLGGCLLACFLAIVVMFLTGLYWEAVVAFVGLLLLLILPIGAPLVWQARDRRGSWRDRFPRQ